MWVIPALKNLRREDSEFVASRSYIKRSQETLSVGGGRNGERRERGERRGGEEEETTAQSQALCYSNTNRLRQPTNIELADGTVKPPRLMSKE